MYRVAPNKYKIGCYVEEGDEGYTEDTKSPGERVAGICTDLWWFSLADYDEFVARDGLTKYNPETQWTVNTFDVTPGTYKFTYHSYDTSFDRDVYYPVTYAEFELVTDGEG